MKWSIREMLLCVVIVALAIPWILSLRQNADVRAALHPLDLSSEQVTEWILALDPAAKTRAGQSGSFGGGGESSNSSLDYSFELVNVSPEKAFEHV